MEECHAPDLARRLLPKRAERPSKRGTYDGSDKFSSPHSTTSLAMASSANAAFGGNPAGHALKRTKRPETRNSYVALGSKCDMPVVNTQCLNSPHERTST